MATRGVTATQGDVGFAKFIWSGLLNGDDGSGAAPGVYGDMSVQAKGTFGTGGTVILEGSLDGGATWSPLTDPGGGAISFTGAGIETVLQYCELIRPRVTAGDGTTNLTVTVVARKPI
jgi:hypothetical protein